MIPPHENCLSWHGGDRERTVPTRVEVRSTEIAASDKLVLTQLDYNHSELS
jgi:hypothetical protein